MSDMYFYPIYHRTYEQRVIVVEKHLLDFIFLELILLMIKTLNLEKIDAHYSSFWRNKEDSCYEKQTRTDQHKSFSFHLLNVESRSFPDAPGWVIDNPISQCQCAV